MSTAAATLAGVETAQIALSVIHTALTLTAYQYPSACAPANLSSWDYIVVGGGTAGLIVANRLTENADLNVLVIEAGGNPPFESELPAMFTLLGNSPYDYNYTTTSDNYSNQNLKDGIFDLQLGKMLGGSGGFDHLYSTQGDANDYNSWGEVTGDSSWSYETIVKYFQKAERMLDEGILNSTYAKYHGTDGYLRVSKPTSDTGKTYLGVFEELGYEIREDLSGETAFGFAEPLFNIGEGSRYSGALGTLAPIKDRTNLCVATFSTVTKVLFDNKKAIGVQMVDSNGDMYNLYAAKEVIVSAGVVKSPQLLGLSGIGDETLLTELGIEVVSALPEVGKNFQDHPCVVVAHQMEYNVEPNSAVNPHEFPVPSVLGYVSLNSSKTSPDVQIINLIFPHDATAQVELSAKVFGYVNDIADRLYAASVNRNTFISAIHVAKPKSRGQVILKSADYQVPPEVYAGHLNDPEDLTLLAKNLENFSKIVNTTYFKSVNAALVDVGVCSDVSADKFWECYALAMSTSMRHYVGTCAMGTVLNSDLTVKGTESLRVIDASSIPFIPIGESRMAVVGLAERGADLILSSLASS